MVEVLIGLVLVILVVFLFTSNRKHKAENDAIKKVVESHKKTEKELLEANKQILQQIKFLDKETVRMRRSVDSLTRKVVDVTSGYARINGKYNKLKSNELKTQIDKAIPDLPITNAMPPTSNSASNH